MELSAAGIEEFIGLRFVQARWSINAENTTNCN
jgi:hypothetical protein